MAHHLSITSQSVGKWERGEGYPDITLLPAIALYFGITVDELLGVGKERIEDEINRYKKKSIELKHKGNAKENYELWKEAYATFPEEYCVQYQYIDALWCVCASEPIGAIDGKIQPWDEKLQDKGAEILSIGNKLLLNCTARKITDPVTQILCNTAEDMGNIPLAKSYAKKLGSLYYTKESILEWVLEGDEGLEQAQNNLLFYLDMLTMTIETVRIKLLSTPEKQEKFEQLCIDLWKCVLGDENLGFYHCRVANKYFKLAADFAVQKRRASVFVHWRKWLITLLHSIKEEMAFIRNRGLKENLILIKSLQKTILQTTVI